MREEDDLTEFEADLRSLRPVAGAVDPVGAAFIAGQRAGRRSIRRWQGAALVALVLVFGVHLPRPESGRVPELPRPLARSPEFVLPVQSSEQSLEVLQQTVHERGIDALPQVQLPRSGAVRANDVL